jgi:hypothetical protein
MVLMISVAAILGEKTGFELDLPIMCVGISHPTAVRHIDGGEVEGLVERIEDYQLGRIAELNGGSISCSTFFL